LKPVCQYVSIFTCVVAFSYSQLAFAEQSLDRVDNESLKQSLAPSDKEKSESANASDIFSNTEDRYSLLQKGQFTSTIDATYSYFESDPSVTLVLIENFRFLDVSADSERVISTTLGFDLGVSNNISVGFSLPFTAKYNEQQDLSVVGLGDVQASVRWQPRPTVGGEVTTLYFLSVSAPTGQSPYEITVGEELSTGQGFPSISFGSTFFKVFDPLIGYGSLSYTHNPVTDGFDQQRIFVTDEVNRLGTLREIQPGDSVSAVVGLSYAITYDFTLTLQYQHTIGGRTSLIWEDLSNTGSIIENETRSATFDSGVARITTSWKGDDGNFFNLNFSLPVTEGLPDVIIGISMPLFP